MSLYNQWLEKLQNFKSKASYNKFWKEYLEKEKKVYEYILENKENVLSGKLAELATKLNMDPVTFVAFIDGINTSLKTSLDVEALTEDSDISLDVDFEKLYYNMLDAKADWLYHLPQWDRILTEEDRKRITKEFRTSKTVVSNKVGRNDPCPCGSGLKYKKCCGK